MVRFQGGSPSRDQEDGKVFPASLDAYEIRDILVRESKAKILYNSKVSLLSKDGEYFHVQTDNGTFTCRNLVLATGGGMSYSLTGSDGSGYALAKTLGHSIIPPQSQLSLPLWWTHIVGRTLQEMQSAQHMQSFIIQEKRNGSSKPQVIYSLPTMDSQVP